MNKKILLLLLPILFFSSIDVFAKNKTVVPDTISFLKSGDSAYQTFNVTAFQNTGYPDLKFYGYYQVVFYDWMSVKWGFSNSNTGDYDLSFIYTGNWLIDSDNPFTFAVKQGNNIFPCDNSNVWNSQSYKDLTNVYCSNVSLTNSDFEIILAFKGPVKTAIQKDSIGITRVNLFQSGFSSLEQQQKEIEDTLKDDNVDGANSSASSFFNDFSTTDQGGISGIVKAPLVAINKMLDSSCSPLTATYEGKEISLPCGSVFWSKLGSLKTFINLTYGGILCYLIAVKLFKLVNNLKNPNDDKVEVMDL